MKYILGQIEYKQPAVVDGRKYERVAVAIETFNVHIEAPHLNNQLFFSKK
jgi:hypothetical protein